MVFWPRHRAPRFHLVYQRARRHPTPSNLIKRRSLDFRFLWTWIEPAFHSVSDPNQEQFDCSRTPPPSPSGPRASTASDAPFAGRRILVFLGASFFPMAELIDDISLGARAWASISLARDTCPFCAASPLALKSSLFFINASLTGRRSWTQPACPLSAAHASAVIPSSFLNLASQSGWSNKSLSRSSRPACAAIINFSLTVFISSLLILWHPPQFFFSMCFICPPQGLQHSFASLFGAEVSRLSASRASQGIWTRSELGDKGRLRRARL